MPIMPNVIHSVPNVTIEKLATELYYIGRAAQRALKEPTSRERMQATLTLITAYAEETLGN